MKRLFFLLACVMLLFTYCTDESFAATKIVYTTSSQINLENKSNIVYNKIKITNATANAVILTNCHDITFTNCYFSDAKLNGIWLENCYNIRIENCYFENVNSGVVADNCPKGNIRVFHSNFKNMKGTGGRGQMVQFGNVGGANNQISYNNCENIPYQSNPEDVINMYQSNGTPSSHIRIYHNWIRGYSTSTSGGGIMTGDMGGSYITVDGNIAVNIGQYGMTVASGHDIIIQNNKIFIAKSPVSNIGLSAYRQYEIPTYNITIQNNKVLCTGFWGERNSMWNAGNCGTVKGWNTNVEDLTLNESILPATIIGVYHY